MLEKQGYAHQGIVTQVVGFLVGQHSRVYYVFHCVWNDDGDILYTPVLRDNISDNIVVGAVQIAVALLC